MLRALTLDFLAAGEEVLLPEGALPHIFPDGVPLGVRLTPGFDEGVRQSDAVLIIAPEFGGILERYTRRAESLDGRLLGTESQGLAIAGDKWLTYQRWQAAGLPVPRTRLLNGAGAGLADATGLPVPRPRLPIGAEAGLADATGQSAPVDGSQPPDLDFPLVLKPRRGAGCAAVQIVERDDDWPPALRQTVSEAQGVGEEELLVQEQVSGRPVSVSLVATPEGVLPLCVNEQHLACQQGKPSYRGGRSPLRHRQAGAALRLAGEACGLLPGLRGWIGVDMLLTAAGPVLLEVNPRLTSAYLGVRQVLVQNPVLYLLGGVRGSPLPSPILSGRSARFTTEDFPGPRPVTVRP